MPKQQPMQSKWIDWQNPRVLWRRLVSTRERRLFCVSFGSAVTITPVDKCRPTNFWLGFVLRLFRQADGVGFLNMLPQTVEVECADLVSKDGVPVRARVVLTLQVKRKMDAARELEQRMRSEGSEQAAQIDRLRKELQSAYKSQLPEGKKATIEDFEGWLKSKGLDLNHLTLSGKRYWQGLLTAFVAAQPDDEEVMKMVCLEPGTQERIVTDLAVGVMQRTCAEWEFDHIHTNRQGLVDSLLEGLNTAVSSAFIVRQVVVHEVQAIDAELARAALELKRLKLATSHAIQQKELRKAEADAEFQRQRLQAVVERDKQLLEVEIKTQLAEVAAKPEGKRVLFGSETHKLEMETVRSQRERERENAESIMNLFEQAIGAASKDGQRQIMDKLLQRRYAANIVTSQPASSTDATNPSVNGEDQDPPEPQR